MLMVRAICRMYFDPNLRTKVLHLDVEERFEELLAPALLCHKEPARRIQSPLLGALERKIPLGIGGFHARKAPIMWRPYAINNQLGALDANGWFFMA